MLHIIHNHGTCIIEAGIDGLSRGNNFGEVMRGQSTLQFVTLVKEVVERSEVVDPWLTS